MADKTVNTENGPQRYIDQCDGTFALLVATRSAPSTSVGGLSVFTTSSLTSKQEVKGSSARWYDRYVYNPNNAVTYLQVFSKPASGVTLGTTAPDLSFPIPAMGYWDRSDAQSYALTNGFTIAATTGRANATPPTNGLDVNIGYL